MNRLQQDQLLTELLTGDEVAGFRRRSLDQSLLALERRRRRRHSLRAGGILSAAALAALAFAALGPVATSPPTAARPPARVASNPTRPFEVKMITDRELFALFPGRPLALIGKPGQQRLVFLDD
jgi:hypothetical protein